MSAAQNNWGVVVTQVNECILCQERGQLLYQSLRDRLFSAPGEWTLFQCPSCGLIWLNPQPVSSEIGKLYTTYYTHGPEVTSLRSRLRDTILITALGGIHRLNGLAWRLLGAILYSVPSIRGAAQVATTHLGKINKGKLLDVGCGAGRLLGLMRDAGWEVQGLEPDSQAAISAQQRLGVPVAVGSIEHANFAEGTFDVVTMSHVLEHLIDPIAALRACRRMLTPGGTVAIVTPCVESLGHRQFRSSWVHLDPPRHLYLFTIRALCELVRRSGLIVKVLHTSPRNAGSAWIASMEIRATGRRHGTGTGLSEMIRGLPFAWTESAANSIWKNCGEEIVLIAAKSE